MTEAYRPDSALGAEAHADDACVLEAGRAGAEVGTIIELLDCVVEDGEVAHEDGGGRESRDTGIEGRIGLEMISEPIGSESVDVKWRRGWHCCVGQKVKTRPKMHLLDLPDDALQLIQTNAQQPGGPIEDVWCRLSIYEHRIRNKVVTQLILSGMVLDDLEWQRFLSHFENRASARKQFLLHFSTIIPFFNSAGFCRCVQRLLEDGGVRCEDGAIPRHGHPDATM